MPRMTDKEKMIAQAALRIFARYGVKRATMNDVAQEAELARQTLYNIFPNKDALLRGTIRYYLDNLQQQVQSEWAGAETLSDKLDILFEHYIVSSWEMIHNSPDAQDLDRGFNMAGRAEIAEAAERMRDMLAGLFGSYERPLAAAGLDDRALAEFVRIAMLGIKHEGESRGHLKSLIAALKASILSLTGEI